MVGSSCCNRSRILSHVSCHWIHLNLQHQSCFMSPFLSKGIWAPSQYPKRRLSVRSRKVSKPRDLYLELSDRSEIWQELRQQCCRCACQISKRYDNLKYQSRGFETLRDLTKRRLFGYWDGAQVSLNLDTAVICGLTLHSNDGLSSQNFSFHDDVIKWKHFPRYWSFVRGIPLTKTSDARSFDVFFDLRLDKRLRKPSRRRWFKTPSRSLWRHCHIRWVV